jgi:hypothetical protein
MRPGTWYIPGDGYNFHLKCKPLLMSVLHGKSTFNDLAKLVINRQWLNVGGETLTLTKSMIMIGAAKDDLIRNIPRLLRGKSWLNRLAIQRLADFIYVLHKSDDMYYERFGYLIWRVIERALDWIATDKAGRSSIIKQERVLYFTHEHREDRLEQINAGWDFLEEMYEHDEAIEVLVNYLVEWIWEHREMYDRDEVSHLKLKQFYPENWYPTGRGQLWNAMHGGKG